jgi:hypothetical protein
MRYAQATPTETLRGHRSAFSLQTSNFFSQARVDSRHSNASKKHSQKEGAEVAEYV